MEKDLEKDPSQPLADSEIKLSISGNRPNLVPFPQRPAMPHQNTDSEYDSTHDEEGEAEEECNSSVSSVMSESDSYPSSSSDEETPLEEKYEQKKQAIQQLREQIGKMIKTISIYRESVEQDQGLLTEQFESERKRWIDREEELLEAIEKLELELNEAEEREEKAAEERKRKNKENLENLQDLFKELNYIEQQNEELNQELEKKSELCKDLENELLEAKKTILELKEQSLQNSVPIKPSELSKISSQSTSELQLSLQREVQRREQISQLVLQLTSLVSISTEDLDVQAQLFKEREEHQKTKILLEENKKQASEAQKNSERLSKRLKEMVREQLESAVISPRQRSPSEASDHPTGPLARRMSIEQHHNTNTPTPSNQPNPLQIAPPPPTPENGAPVPQDPSPRRLSLTRAQTMKTIKPEPQANNVSLQSASAFLDRSSEKEGNHHHHHHHHGLRATASRKALPTSFLQKKTSQDEYDDKSTNSSSHSSLGSALTTLTSPPPISTPLKTDSRAFVSAEVISLTRQKKDEENLNRLISPPAKKRDWSKPIEARSHASISTSGEEPRTPEMLEGSRVKLLENLSSKALKKMSETEVVDLLISAVTTGNQAAMDKILRLNKNLLDIKDPHKTPLLLLAVLGNHLGCTKSLLDQGANMSTLDNNGWNVMHCAARAKDPNLMKLIMSHKKKISELATVKNNLGEIPLHILCKNKSTTPDVVSPMAKIFGTLELPNDKGETPLHVAVLHADPKFYFPVELLLKAGAKTEAKTKEGDTPLILAILHPRSTSTTPKVVQLLLSAGADPTPQSSRGDINQICEATQAPEEVRALIKRSIEKRARSSTRRLSVIAEPDSRRGSFASASDIISVVVTCPQVSNTQFKTSVPISWTIEKLNSMCMNKFPPLPEGFRLHIGNTPLDPDKSIAEYPEIIKTPELEFKNTVSEPSLLRRVSTRPTLTKTQSTLLGSDLLIDQLPTWISLRDYTGARFWVHSTTGRVTRVAPQKTPLSARGSPSSILSLRNRKDSIRTRRTSFFSGSSLMELFSSVSQDSNVTMSTLHKPTVIIQALGRTFLARRQLKELKILNKGRFLLVKEVSTLESTYWPGLKILAEEYIPQVLKTFVTLPAELSKLFKFVEQFSKWHAKFREFLSSSVQHWHPSCPIGREYFIDYAGLIESLQEYTILYWKNYPLFTSQKYILKLTKSKMNLNRIHLLTNLLSSPIDHMLQISSLFRKILAHTLPTANDYVDLRISEPLFHSFAPIINALHTKNAGFEKVKSVQTNLKGAPNFAVEGRTFIHEGFLKRDKSKKIYHCWLFSDLFVIGVSEKKVVKFVEMVHFNSQTQIYCLSSELNAIVFTNPKVHQFFAINQEEHKQWVSAMENALFELKKKDSNSFGSQGSLMINLPSSPTKLAKVLSPQETMVIFQEACGVCQNKLSKNKKAECDSCNLSVCTTCFSREQRMCNNCSKRSTTLRQSTKTPSPLSPKFELYFMPDNILRIIFAYVGLPHISKVIQSCRRFWIMAKKPGIWEEVCLALYPRSVAYGPETWKDKLRSEWSWRKRKINKMVIPNAHSTKITCIRFAPDNVFVSSSSDGDVKLWKLTQDEIKPLKTLPHKTGVISVEIDFIYNRIFSVSEGSVYIWDLNGSPQGKKELSPSSITTFQYIPQLEAFVIACSDKTVSVIDTKNFSTKIKIQTDETVVCLYADSDIILAGAGYQVLLYDLKSGKKLSSIQIASEIRCVDFFNQYVAVGHKTGVDFLQVGSKDIRKMSRLGECSALQLDDTKVVLFESAELKIWDIELMAFVRFLPAKSISELCFEQEVLLCGTLYGDMICYSPK